MRGKQQYKDSTQSFDFCKLAWKRLNTFSEGWLTKNISWKMVYQFFGRKFGLRKEETRKLIFKLKEEGYPFYFSAKGVTLETSYGSKLSRELEEKVAGRGRA